MKFTDFLTEARISKDWITKLQDDEEGIVKRYQKAKAFKHVKSFKDIGDVYVSEKIGKKDYKMRARWDIQWQWIDNFENGKAFDRAMRDDKNVYDSHRDTMLKKATGIR